MKMILLVIFAVMLFLSGCRVKHDAVKDFIPGVYYASWKTSFSTAVDTMRIEPLTKDGSEGYLIIRRTHLQFVNASKKRAPEYSMSKWQGAYNSADKTIVVPSKGRILYFDPVSKILKMGTVVYKKL